LEKKWNILQKDETATKALKDSLKINETICAMLVQRGITNFDEAKKFFRPDLNNLHDPWLMKDMRKAVDRVENAILNKEKIKEYHKEYRQNNKEKRNTKQKDRKEKDPIFKLSCNIRNVLYNFLKNKGYTKKSKSIDILGCSYEDFKLYLETKFESWMNWQNYGNPVDGLIEPNKTWDIDHIIPISSAINEDELLKLNHYTNLQPLCSYYNRFVKKNNF